MDTDALRGAFVDFFVERGHKYVPSASLVPRGDASLLFTNSGMVQFKRALAGLEKLSYDRAVTIQRCIRAGGKHNDLENVGYTARHHTFFEMMGNFSFGDYFKEEAIEWAWHFSTQVLSLPKDRIWITVHPEDEKSRQIWLQHGVESSRILPIKENFWQMGDTGPCGACSELFYDHGEHVAGSLPGTPDEDGDRFVEFWNLVFPEFNRTSDGTLNLLERPGIDTGMGLERLAAIMQGVTSNYDTDAFVTIKEATKHLLSVEGDTPQKDASLNVIADHLRASVFLVLDGVLPGNEDRSYVLRRIIRRALRHGYKLDADGTFFASLVPFVTAQMESVCPEALREQAYIASVLQREEEQFLQTLEQGMRVFERKLPDISGKTVPGDLVFTLYDTHGFPPDLTADLAREHGMVLDMKGFDQAMEQQRQRARQGKQFAFVSSFDDKLSKEKVEFVGYDHLDSECSVVAMYSYQDARWEAERVLRVGQESGIVLDKTPFYAESGGQVGDCGEITFFDEKFSDIKSDVPCDKQKWVFSVKDTIKLGEQTLHIGKVGIRLNADDEMQGKVDYSRSDTTAIKVGSVGEAKVDKEKRLGAANHHSATHLLHAALRQELGKQVVQKGSLVTPNRLRFDFSYPQPLTAEQLEAITEMVNREIWRNTSVQTQVMSHKDAVDHGAMALFGEQYDDQVRVLSMGEEGFSCELCGGTHAQRTGDLGLFCIISEVGVASGVRRIEALVGASAMEHFSKIQKSYTEVMGKLKCASGEVVSQLKQLQEQIATQEGAVKRLQKAQLQYQMQDVIAEAETIDDITVIVRHCSAKDDIPDLMGALDYLKGQLSSDYVVMLTHEKDKKVSALGAVSKKLSKRLDAREIIAPVVEQIGAKGGGKPMLARAGGGSNLEVVEDALAEAKRGLINILNSQ